MDGRKWDTLIVGGGPAGLSAAIYARRAGLRVLVAEKDPMGLGQIAESGHVDNYPGFAGISGYDLGMAFREHAAGGGVSFCRGEAVGLKQDPAGWIVTMKDGASYEAGTVIYCAGALHRRLGVPGEDTFYGRGVSYCAICDGAFFRGKTAVVVGGGNTALDDALYLSELCERVDVVHRRKEFRGLKRTLEQLRQKENVELVTEARVAEITGKSRPEGVRLQDGRLLFADGVFVAVGMIPQTECLREIVSLDENGYVPAGEDGMTDRAGFFVAGDVRAKKLRQVVTAVADGANAATSAAAYLSGDRSYAG